MEIFRQLSDVNVLCMKAQKFPDEVQQTFDKLDRMIAHREKRTFYGISYLDETGVIVYNAAATEIEKNEAKKFKLESFTIPRGEYFVERIKNWKNNIPKIATIFERMLRDTRVDETFPCIEWYKNENELLCMVKTKL